MLKSQTDATPIPDEIEILPVSNAASSLGPAATSRWPSPILPTMTVWIAQGNLEAVKTQE